MVALARYVRLNLATTRPCAVCRLGAHVRIGSKRVAAKSNELAAATRGAASQYGPVRGGDSIPAFFLSYTTRFRWRPVERGLPDSMVQWMHNNHSCSYTAERCCLRGKAKLYSTKGDDAPWAWNSSTVRPSVLLIGSSPFDRYRSSRAEASQLE